MYFDTTQFIEIFGIDIYMLSVFIVLFCHNQICHH